MPMPKHFLSSELIEWIEFRILFSVTSLEEGKILTEGLLGGREPVSWTMPGIVFRPSFGDRGCVSEIFFMQLLGDFVSGLEFTIDLALKTVLW